MSLKYELQNITTAEITNVNTTLQERLDSVSQEDLADETLAAITSYPTLNQLVILVLDQALGEGLVTEEAMQRSVGASHALLVLTTIAELRDLPPV